MRNEFDELDQFDDGAAPMCPRSCRSIGSCGEIGWLAFVQVALLVTLGWEATFHFEMLPARLRIQDWDLGAYALISNIVGWTAFLSSFLGLVIRIRVVCCCRPELNRAITDDDQLLHFLCDKRFSLCQKLSVWPAVLFVGSFVWSALGFGVLFEGSFYEEELFEYLYPAMFGGRLLVSMTICGILFSVSLGFFVQLCNRDQNVGRNFRRVGEYIQEGEHRAQIAPEDAIPSSTCPTWCGVIGSYLEILILLVLQILALGFLIAEMAQISVGSWFLEFCLLISSSLKFVIFVSTLIVLVGRITVYCCSTPRAEVISFDLPGVSGLCCCNLRALTGLIWPLVTFVGHSISAMIGTILFFVFIRLWYFHEGWAAHDEQFVRWWLAAAIIQILISLPLVLITAYVLIASVHHLHNLRQREERRESNFQNLEEICARVDTEGQEEQLE